MNSKFFLLIKFILDQSSYLFRLLLALLRTLLLGTEFEETPNGVTAFLLETGFLSTAGLAARTFFFFLPAFLAAFSIAFSIALEDFTNFLASSFAWSFTDLEIFFVASGW